MLHPERPIAPELHAARLAELRWALGLTQAAIAEVLGIGEATVAKWEQDRDQPAGLLLDFYRALDCLEHRKGADGLRELLKIAATQGRSAFVVSLFVALQGDG